MMSAGVGVLFFSRCYPRKGHDASRGQCALFFRMLSFLFVCLSASLVFSMEAHRRPTFKEEIEKLAIEFSDLPVEEYEQGLAKFRQETFPYRVRYTDVDFSQLERPYEEEIHARTMTRLIGITRVWRGEPTRKQHLKAQREAAEDAAWWAAQSEDDEDIEDLIFDFVQINI